MNSLLVVEHSPLILTIIIGMNVSLGSPRRAELLHHLHVRTQSTKLDFLHKNVLDTKDDDIFRKAADNLRLGIAFHRLEVLHHQLHPAVLNADSAQDGIKAAILEFKIKNLPLRSQTLPIQIRQRGYEIVVNMGHESRVGVEFSIRQRVQLRPAFLAQNQSFDFACG
nr:protein argonaute 4-like [Ipomoea batatas]